MAGGSCHLSQARGSSDLAMAELHGGELSVESEIGIGTTVAITFPAERVVGQGRIPVRLLAQPH